MQSISVADAKAILLKGLNDEQRTAVQSKATRLLVVAGAGAGKTDVMARRIAWHVAVDGISKNRIVAFTFTERAAEEMKFRIRKYIGMITPEGEDATIGDMYVGTIHGFCLDRLRRLDPDVYHNYDVLDDVSRLSLIERTSYNVLGLAAYQKAISTGKFPKGKYATIDEFAAGYDIMNEYALCDVRLRPDPIPDKVEDDAEWCKAAEMITDVGDSAAAIAFAKSAARYYAVLRSRHFLDFSTAQNEFVRLLHAKPELLERLRSEIDVVVVDEVQDLNPVQNMALEQIAPAGTRLTAVGDHRQAIFGFRGSRVEIMGDLHEGVDKDDAGEVVELSKNYRSTPRIINLANRWAQRIGAVHTMSAVDMEHGHQERVDDDPSHVACLVFADEEQEAEWIAGAVGKLVDGRGLKGAKHGDRGIGFADVAVLLRSTGSARTYMQALQRHGIPAVCRAGPDLFSQPEVLLFVAALLGAAGIDEIPGSPTNPKSVPERIKAALGCSPVPTTTMKAAAKACKAEGLAVDADGLNRLVLATKLFVQHLDPEAERPKSKDLDRLRSATLRKMFKGKTPRRVFPQSVYLGLCEEFGVGAWDDGSARGQTAMFHLGALSTIVTGIESSGWTAARAFKSQMIGLALYGAKSGRTEEAPLLVQPDAVTVATIHAVKGLEFAAVFLADVRSRRFPSQMARRKDVYPFGGHAADVIKPEYHCDNDNYDAERRLMYVALTRAERFLFVTTPKPSPFYKEVARDIDAVGGIADAVPTKVPANVTHDATTYRRDFRLVTSFSDLRYYLECPHDFYLRKVLGFAPTIDQAFGYGRGVHNLLRAIHTEPEKYAALAKDPQRLREAVEKLVNQGLFYMRYTTGEPLDLMRNKAVSVVCDYVNTYAGELERLRFEPERPFETLLEDAGALVSGAIDIVRLDSPPRVTLIDFKSGESDSDISSKLDTEEMRLQVTLYGLAAEKELEFEPERGLVRYLGETDPEKRELSVPLDEESMTVARGTVVTAVGGIRDRHFRRGPREPKDGEKRRCQGCDFRSVCAVQHEKSA